MSFHHQSESPDGRKRQGKKRANVDHSEKAGKDARDSEDIRRGNPDGHRFPGNDNAPHMIIFPCPFQKYDPSNSIERWNVIWQNCFPGTAAPSPSSKEVIPRSEAQLILEELLVSSAAVPWSSEEIRQSAIEKALSAIYCGSPVNRIEPQPERFAEFAHQHQPLTEVEDNFFHIFDHGAPIGPFHIEPHTIEWPSTDPFVSEPRSFRPLDLSSNVPPVSRYLESTIDGLGVNSPGVPKSSVDAWDIKRWTNLKVAILDADHDKVHDMLKSSFDQVATDEYEWLLELKALGLSMDEIADELLESSKHGPWIYSKINVSNVETYRHGFHIPQCLHSGKEDETMSTVSSQPNHGLMSIENDSKNLVRETIGYLSGVGGVSPTPDGSHNLQFGSGVFRDANSTAIISLTNNESVQVVPNVLQNLEKAIGTLQQVGGCCDSFTFLARRESLVELERIDPGSSSGLEPLISHTNPEASFKDLDPQLLPSLTAQFFSLAFALYSQGHCEPFRPFFLDTPLKRILLIGNQIWGPSFNGPCILASPVELSCFGEMVQRQVFAFQYFEAFERSKVFSDLDIQLDLKACPEDLLDTWGPGDFIVPHDNSERLHVISIGGGLITSQSTENPQSPALHWSRASECNMEISSTFSRNEKNIIGSRVSINQACRVTPQEQVQMAIPWLKELGTFPSYWEVSERQLRLGIQARQSAVGPRSPTFLPKKPLSIADLEAPFAVQVSFCTGISRRVRLRELLADVLPAYVADLAVAPVHWKRLRGCNILQILRDDDFMTHYERLDRELQAEFEALAIAVLFLL
ncbi:hypothetical protein HG530_001593 [Fusarium avenaceum]|nr:hypothetical protein HG530_001593 [Fusarium avenaceum]